MKKFLREVILIQFCHTIEQSQMPYRLNCEMKTIIISLNVFSLQIWLKGSLLEAKQESTGVPNL